ncbi:MULTISPECIES: ABC transporter substrate-binding protein [unclassified Chelatococcus]|uniref:ABC transporter substrate-binding protein n=1 Tax=unclassified Chelatococcus TaxID=2638111 RepID=UPI0002DAD855|nr:MULTISPECIES: ABC transporter substrate-binding protein [unclassified Chelatococcus]ALA18967.1 ABC transporter substrate-binding protein [Chelatococcus sp. CO-6]
MTLSEFLRPFLGACGAAALFALAPPAVAGQTQYPLTVTNCGRDLTFTRAPARTVSVGQSATEILYLLGLAEKVVGTAVWLGPVIEGYEEVNATIPRLADNDPSFESVLGAKPDLVATQFQWQIGPQGVVATPEQFAELGIPVYTSPADCIGKDNSSGGDGVRTAKFSMDLIYQEIDDLARIFDVKERADELIAELKAREAAARQKIASLDGKVSAVFWFSSAELDIDPYVAGLSGAPGYIMATLGIRNVIDSEEEWPTVGWETIARANPTVLVAGRMDRRRYPADDIAVKLKFLETDPVARLMPAVKDGRVVVMDAQAMNPTIRTIEGIEVLAEALEKSGLVASGPAK